MSEGSQPSPLSSQQTPSPQPSTASDAADSGVASGSLPPSLLACYTCKLRKLRCDKTLPVCGRCAKAREECEYPSERRRPTVPVARPRVRNLQAKIRMCSSCQSRATPSRKKNVVDECWQVSWRANWNRTARAPRLSRPKRSSSPPAGSTNCRLTMSSKSCNPRIPFAF